MLDHLDDLDADFRRFYRIDIENDDLGAPEFFRLARRVFAYGGVMASRWRETSPPAPSTPEPSRVVDLDAWKRKYPQFNWVR